MGRVELNSFFARFGCCPRQHFRIEGRHHLEAALAADWPLELILHHGAPHSTWPAHLLQHCERDELNQVLGFHFHRGVIAIGRRPLLASLPQPTPQFLLGLIGIADPGNLGTLIRSAAAFGVGAVLCDKACTDPFNAKSVRASSTAIFRIPVLCGVDFHTLPQLDHATWLATSSHASALSLADYQLTRQSGPSAVKPHLLLLGNEGTGLPADLLRRAEFQIRIEHQTMIESLNVASAGAILLYRLRQLLADQSSPHHASINHS